MKNLFVPRPISAGVILSYECNSMCKHCMYACSPKFRSGWVSEDNLEKILSYLSGKILPSPLGSNRVSLNYGLHFTGGEPFLNFNLLVKAVKLAKKFQIPSTFVETNSFWCMDDKTTYEKLLKLKNFGLNGILISVNPFLIEHIPFERIERNVRLSNEIFGVNTLVYQEEFYRQFKLINLKGTLPFYDYLNKFGYEGLSSAELLPMGRAVYELSSFFQKLPAKYFFKESCKHEITRNWHVHIDSYGNYIPGYCGGISLGSIYSISDEINLEDLTIVSLLMKNLESLYSFASHEFNYEERKDGYVSKCHLCLDIRKHIVSQTEKFPELKPIEFYLNL